MICHEIAEQSILYMDKLLKKNKAKKFEMHLQKCEKCRKKFGIIASNYDCSLNSSNIPDIKADIMSEINPSRYLSNNTKRRMKRWVVIAVGLVLMIGVSVNAQDIYKSLEDLIKSMSPTNEYVEHMKRAAGEDGPGLVERKINIPYKEYGNMFAKVEEKVFEKGNQMTSGEYAELLYPDLHEGFYVKLYKLSNGRLSIVYGIKDGHQIGIGEHDSISSVGASSDRNVIQQTINNGCFIAIPDYLPKNYYFKDIVTSDGRVQQINYIDGTGNNLSIAYEFYADYKLEDYETSLIEVNEKQAVYLETEEGEILYLYLGDNLDKKVIKLSAQSIGKEELINIAKSLVYFNEESNLLSKDNYFRGMKDKRLENIYDEVISREKTGDKMFEIYVTGKRGDKEIVKFDKNDAGPGGWCMVNYMGMPYERVKQYLNYPLYFDKTFINRFKLDGATVSFRPFQEVKRVMYALVPDDEDIKKTVFVEASGLPIEYKRYTKLDILMMRYLSTNDTNIINDGEGQHYAVRQTENGIIIETIKEVENRYVSYTINLPEEFYKDMDYKDIVKNFDLIE